METTYTNVALNDKFVAYNICFIDLHGFYHRGFGRVYVGKNGLFKTKNRRLI